MFIEGTGGGLFIIVWTVPGVPEAVILGLQTNAIGLLVSIGGP